MAKAPSIGRLHPGRGQVHVHFDRSSNDPFGELFMKKFTPWSPCLRGESVCSTPTLNSATSGFSAAASSALRNRGRASRWGSMILSIHNLAAP